MPDETQSDGQPIPDTQPDSGSQSTESGDGGAEQPGDGKPTTIHTVTRGLPASPSKESEQREK